MVSKGPGFQAAPIRLLKKESSSQSQIGGHQAYLPWPGVCQLGSLFLVKRVLVHPVSDELLSLVKEDNYSCL